MKVKIAINPTYGCLMIPSQFIDKINNECKNFRVTLAECIGELQDTHKEIDTDTYVNFKNQKTEWYIKAGNDFYFKDLEEGFNVVYNLEIVEIDTNKKWKITEYDGAEGVVYFNEPKVMDEELNMCEWC